MVIIMGNELIACGVVSFFIPLFSPAAIDKSSLRPDWGEGVPLYSTATPCVLVIYLTLKPSVPAALGGPWMRDSVFAPEGTSPLQF